MSSTNRIQSPFKPNSNHPQITQKPTKFKSKNQLPSVQISKPLYSTGPHLHYEFRIKGSQVDPKTLNLPYSFPLEPRHLARFKAQTESVKKLLSKR